MKLVRGNVALAEPVLQVSFIEALIGKSKATGETNLVLFRTELEFDGC